MFGQHPQVGISNLPIDRNLLSNLATEMDVNRCLGLPLDVPLEQATLCASLAAEGSIGNPLLHLRHLDTEGQEQAEKLICNRTTESQNVSKQSVPGFHSVGFTSDKTDALIERLIKLATVKSTRENYFGWKGVGFQCGICFNALPSHVSFTVNNHLMMSMNQEPPENTRKSPPESLFSPSNQLFLPSMLSQDSKYIDDVRHPWLSILLKIKVPTDASVLDKARIRQCFSILDKESTMTDQWRRVVIRKARKSIWEVLDEFNESVLDTVVKTGNKGLIEQWGTLFRAPTIEDYNEAVTVYGKQKRKMDEKDHQLMESPGRKHLRDKAFESLAQQGRMMKKRAQAKMGATFDVGTVVQVPLHDVDTTKADGKNLTLIVVDIVQKKDNSCAMYRLACKAGVLDTLYHPSYMTSVAANSKVLGLDNVLDEWTGLPRIKERKAAASVSMVGGQGKHLGCGCKNGTCRTGRCSCFKAGLECNSKCHGGINKNCINKDLGKDI
jgi:hypothetical protein